MTDEQRWISRRGFLLTPATAPLVSLAQESAGPNWYERSFYLLHLDHHTNERSEVGKDADPAETARLLALSRPDVIQIHAKGRPGWTTYPSKVGYTPPELVRDVLQVWTDIARRDGYRFSAYYNLGRDGEIMKRRPEWNRVKADGTPWDTALCYHSGVAESYLWPMIGEVMARYHPDGFWFDGSCFTVSVCYCTRCRNRFRREHSMEAPADPGKPGWAEFKEMQRAIYREFVAGTVARIKRRYAACLVAVNWAYSLRMPEPAVGVDYLTGDTAATVDMLPLQARWYDAQAKPFDLMTTVFLKHPDGMKPKPAAQIEQEMAIIAANGGRFFAWDNPTAGSGLVAERQQFTADVVAPFLRRRQKWCLGSVRVPDVSLLNSAADQYASTLATPICFVWAGKRLSDPAEALDREHLNYELVGSERLERGDVRSPVLIADDPRVLGVKELDGLRRWVSGGGTLILTGVRYANEFGTASGPFARRQMGKGEVFRSEAPLGALPSGVRRDLLDAALPRARRKLVVSAPESVDVILRRNGSGLVVHFVNRDRGRREELNVPPPSPRQRITAIAPAPACHVSLALPSRPTAVTLQPDGREAKGWSYAKGRLEVDVPGFAIHQMMVVTGA